MVRGRLWAGVPLGVRVIAGAAVAVFGYGTAVHVWQLAGGGWSAYRGVPGWLAGYFVALVVLDPAAAGLLAYRRRSGLLLGCAVLLSDAAANGYANYAVRTGPGCTAGRAGQAVVTVLAVALLVVAPRVWPWLRPDSGDRVTGGAGALRLVVDLQQAEVAVDGDRPRSPRSRRWAETTRSGWARSWTRCAGAWRSRTLQAPFRSGVGHASLPLAVARPG